MLRILLPFNAFFYILFFAKGRIGRLQFIVVYTNEINLSRILFFDRVKGLDEAALKRYHYPRMWLSQSLSEKVLEPCKDEMFIAA